MTNQARVGIFSTATIIIFVLGFYFLKGVNLFERKNVYYAVYDRVDGLYKSNQVEIKGYPVGRVAAMSYNPVSGKIVVELTLNKDIKVTKSDSTMAQLISVDLLGSKKVSLVMGQSNEFLSPGDTINTYFKKDVMEQLGPQVGDVVSDVKLMLPKLDSSLAGIKLLFDVNDPRSIYTTFAKVNSALTKVDTILARNGETLKLTIRNLESITANIEKSNDQITKILKNAGSFTDSLQQSNIKQTIQNLNASIDQLKAMLSDVNQGKGTLGKIVKSDALYAKVDSTVSNLNNLVKDVKARPYRYISINVLGAKKAEERREKKYNEAGK